MGAPEVRICYERAESLCHSLNRPLLLYSALIGQWRYSLMTDKLTATMQIAKRVYSLAQEQNDSALMIGAYNALAATLYYYGRFRGRATIRDAWRSDLALGKRPVSCRRGRRARRQLFCAMEAMPSGILERSPLAKRLMAEAISLAKR